MSLLVACGKGDRCNLYRNKLKETLLCIEPTTGELKVNVHKFGKEKYPDLYKKIAKEVAIITNPYIKDIDINVFTIVTTSDGEKHEKNK